MPSEDEWRMYARDLQDTKEDLYFIDSLVHRGISKVSIYNSNLSILFYFVFCKIDRSIGNIYKSLYIAYMD